MCYTDTDSLILKIDTDDLYRDMALSKHLYDFSNYANDHFIYSEENKDKLGTFKDECQSKPIKELVALRAKMYAFVLADKAETVTAKGMKTRNLRFQQYKQTLINNENDVRNACLEKLRPSNSYGQNSEDRTFRI